MLDTTENHLKYFKQNSKDFKTKHTAESSYLDK